MQEGLALLPTPGSSCSLQKVRRSEQTCGQKAGPRTLTGRLEAWEGMGRPWEAVVLSHRGGHEAGSEVGQ